MSEPTQDVTWASNANYDATGQPYDGTPTQTEPDSGRKANGWEPNMKPPAQEMNWWMAAVAAWIMYFANNNSAPVGVKPNLLNVNGNMDGLFAPIEYSGSSLIGCGVPNGVSVAGGGFNGTFPVPPNRQLATIETTFVAPVTNTVSIEFIQNTQTSAPVVLGTYTYAGTGTTTGDATTINLLAESDVQAFTAASGGIYTRTTGSYVTDGFFVGQVVEWTGFSNSANNVTGTITAVSATSMTISTTGQIAETAGASQVQGVMPTMDGTWIMSVFIQTTGSATSIGSGCTWFKTTYA